MQTLFLAGNVPRILLLNCLYLAVAAVVLIGATAHFTKRRLD